LKNTVLTDNNRLTSYGRLFWLNNFIHDEGYMLKKM